MLKNGKIALLIAIIVVIINYLTANPISAVQDISLSSGNCMTLLLGIAIWLIIKKEKPEIHHHYYYEDEEPGDDPEQSPVDTKQ